MFSGPNVIHLMEFPGVAPPHCFLLIFLFWIEPTTAPVPVGMVGDMCTIAGYPCHHLFSLKRPPDLADCFSGLGGRSLRFGRLELRRNPCSLNLLELNGFVPNFLEIGMCTP